MGTQHETALPTQHFLPPRGTVTTAPRCWPTLQYITNFRTNILAGLGLVKVWGEMTVATCKRVDKGTPGGRSSQSVNYNGKCVCPSGQEAAPGSEACLLLTSLQQHTIQLFLKGRQEQVLGKGNRKRAARVPAQPR